MCSLIYLCLLWLWGEVITEVVYDATPAQVGDHLSISWAIVLCVAWLGTLELIAAKYRVKRDGIVLQEPSASQTWHPEHTHSAQKFCQMEHVRAGIFCARNNILSPYKGWQLSLREIRIVWCHERIWLWLSTIFHLLHYFLRPVFISLYVANTSI